jgi:hypothetical protein
MTPQFLQLIPYLKIRDRSFRFIPTEVTTSEYITQMGRLAIALENLIKVGTSGPASIHLARLTELSAEILATYCMLGLSETYALGIAEFAKRTISSPTPDYKILLDKVYGNNDDDDDEDDTPYHTF